MSDPVLRARDKLLLALIVTASLVSISRACGVQDIHALIALLREVVGG